MSGSQHSAGRLRPTRPLVVLLVLALAVAAERAGLVRLGAPIPGNAPPAATAERAAPSRDAGTVEQLFRERASGTMVELDARVQRLLPDDDDGSRHQRFVIRLAGGRTLLVAHNLDLAPRVPLAPGDALRVRGQYEWNERGGVLHWTHHDPAGRHAEGWVEHAGRRYE